MMDMHMALALTIIKARNGVPWKEDWPLAVASLFVANAVIELERGIRDALEQEDIHAVLAAFGRWNNWYLLPEDRETLDQAE